MIQIADSSETSVSRKLHCAEYKEKQNAILKSASFTTPNVMAHNNSLEELSSLSSIRGYYYNLVVKGRRLQTFETLRYVF
jgi:predicted Zn-dependent peptidase